MSQSTHNRYVTDFFGTLNEIIQLDYNERSVVLFKCDWFKLDGKRIELKDGGFFKSINVQSIWYKNYCYILVTHAMKVFYLPDTRFGKNNKLYRHLNTYIFTMLTKRRQYNIILLHIKRMAAMKSRACENQV
jgi:predicted patatin/cPLA2 family phospholipase